MIVERFVANYGGLCLIFTIDCCVCLRRLLNWFSWLGSPESDLCR